MCAMFDESSQTVALTTAAARIGMGRSKAYDLANAAPDENGVVWLIPGVRVIRISSRCRVLKRELDAVLGPVELTDRRAS